MEAKLTRVPAAPHVTAADWLTAERAGYGFFMVVALAVRLIGLSWQPLGPAEAAQALPAWAAASDFGFRTSDFGFRISDFGLVGISPLLFSLQRLLFTPFGASDVLARWWPALLGGLAPLCFYGLRDRLTGGGALMAALLWALSPMAVFAGRLGLGYGLVPPLALAWLASLNLYIGTKSARWLAWAAVAFGLMLAAGPGAYTAVVAGVGAALIWRAELPALGEAVRAHRRGVLLATLLPLTLSTTFFLTVPGGLAATVDLLGSWLRGLAPAASEYSPWDLLRRLLLSEPLLLGLGLAGLVTTRRQRDHFGLFAAIAAGLSLLAPLVGRGRHPADLGLVVLALALLAGPVLAQVLRTAWSWRCELDPWLLTALSLALLTSAAICLPGAVNPANNISWRQLYTGVGIATALLSVGVWAVYGVWGSWRTVVAALPVVPLVLGLAWSISQLSGLNYDRGAWRQAAVQVEMPASGLRDLQTTLRHLSALHGGGPRETQVDLVLPRLDSQSAAGSPCHPITLSPCHLPPLVPMLRWALRDFGGLRTVTALPADPAPIVITIPEEQPALSETYSGAGFTVLQRWQPQGLGGFNPWLRWVIYREAKIPAEGTSVVLWVDRTRQ